MKDFWNKQIEKKGKLIMLAPMDWYGDSAYRQSIKRVSPHVICVSEFYSSDWLFYSKFLAWEVLPHAKSEDPLIIQIFWKTPEMFANAAKIISNSKYNIAWIDVNMWCPAKKVIKSWHWSSLMINEQTAYDIVEALNQATHLPISVKTRLSFDWNQNLINFVQWLEKAWASLIQIHWRTAKQAYTWVADFTDIYELKKHVNIPVVCNWDIKNYTDWMEKIKNLDGIMLGRGSFWNPWCFIWEEQIKDKDFIKKTGVNPNNFIDWAYHPTLNEILEAMEFHATKLVETKWEKKWSLEIRKHLVQYLKNFPWVKEYRKRLVTTENIANTSKVLSEIKEVFKNKLEKRPSLNEIEKEDEE